MIANTVLFLALAQAASAQPLPEVRQLVTFRFLPGKSQQAVALFREEALPVYSELDEMLRFRGYREAESPEPLDLIVVSTFRGMAGMDAYHESMRDHRAAIGALYGRIGALSAHHRDEFFEVDPKLSWGELDRASRIVFISSRIAPGRIEAFERLVGEHLVPWEKSLGKTFHGSDGGPFLVSDGWDHMRIVGVESLGDWHRYLRERRAQPWARLLDEMVTASKQIIVAPVPELSLR